MRGKEEAHDYRYLPDPDLLPLVVDQAWIDKTRDGLPELPQAKRERFIADYGLTDYDAGVLTASKPVAQYFEDAVAAGAEAKAASNWITSELMGALNAEGLDIGDAKINPDGLAELIKLIAGGTLSSKLAKEVFGHMFESGKSASVIVEEKGLKQVSDSGELEGVLQKIFDDNPDEVAQFKAGKQKLMGFFVGQVMKQTKGQANPIRCWKGLFPQ